MSNRIIREGILDSEAVNALSEGAEIFYRRLMSVVDDFGRFEADAALLRNRLFWRQFDRWPEDRIEAMLAEVSATLNADAIPLVRVYAYGRKRYLEMSNFGKPRAKESRFPQPPTPESACKQMQAGANTSEHVNTHVDACLPGGSPNRIESNNIQKKTTELPKEWEEFRGLYPPHRFDEDAACRAWVSRDAEHLAIIEGLRTAVASKDWLRDDGEYVPWASKFIFDGKYRVKYRAAAAPASAVESTMDPETRRRLEERKRNG